MPPASNGTLPAPGGNGTFPYDGGPQVPVPMPRADQAAPQVVPPVPSRAAPRPAVPAEGRIVSLPAPQKTKFAYPAYGEKRLGTSFASDRTVAVKKQPVQAARR